MILKFFQNGQTLHTINHFLISAVAQDNQFHNSSQMQSNQQAYSKDLNGPKIMIVPFDSKMYVSSVDRAIAKRTD